MQAVFKNRWTKLLTVAVVTAAAALTLVVVEPYPTDVLGQTPPGRTPTGPGCDIDPCPPGFVPEVGSPYANCFKCGFLSFTSAGDTFEAGGFRLESLSAQPVNADVLESSMTLLAPAGFTLEVAGADCTQVDGQTNVVSCAISDDSNVTFTTVANEAFVAPSGAPSRGR
jgi:hypothetical protein